MKTNLAIVPVILVLFMSIMNVAVTIRFGDQDGFSPLIVEFMAFTEPRNEYEFQAIIYPLFLTGEQPNNYLTLYEARLDDNRRMDLFIQHQQTRSCIVIELKYQRTAQEAINQAIRYVNWLEDNASDVCSSVCAIGINLTQNNDIQLIGFYNQHRDQTAYLYYRQNIVVYLRNNVHRMYTQISAFLRGQVLQDHDELEETKEPSSSGEKPQTVGPSNEAVLDGTPLEEEQAKDDSL